MNVPRYMTVNEVADRLRVSRHTIYNLVERREIRSARIGRTVRLRESDVLAYLDAVETDAKGVAA